MALAKNEKEKIVEEVKAVVADASTLVISDARGLKVSELSEIRKEAGWRSSENKKYFRWVSELKRYKKYIIYYK